jgi:hypothetical protein
MKQILRTILLAIIFLPQLIFFSCRQAPEEFSASDKYRLVWTDDPSTTITVAWDQLDGGSAEVYYGPVDQGREYWEYPASKVPQQEMNRYDMHTRFAKLSGLSPGTPYYFVIKDKSGVSKRYWFKTAPGQPEPFTFIAGGDTKSEDEPLEAGRASNRLVSKLRPLFVIYNGDFTSGDGTDPENWKQWLIDWHTLTTTDDGLMIPIFPVMGNHERGNKRNLNIIFNAPYQNNDTTHVYNSLNVGGELLHMIALNSEIRIDSLQKKWLVRDMEAHRNFQFKMAGYHKPFSPHTQRKSEKPLIYNAWGRIFYDYGLDLSIDADSHMHKITFPLKPDSTEQAYMGFIRDDANGTMFIGEGSWGAMPRENNDDKPWTLTSGSFNQLKWIHVFPEQEDAEARMDIFTVISCEYDEAGQQHFYDEIEALSEDNLFSLPTGIRLHQMENYGSVVKYPFHLNEEH